MPIKKYARKMIFIGLALALLPTVACDENVTTPGVERSASSYLKEGWDKFSAGRYNESIIPFNLAVDKEPQEPSGYNGLGWSLTKIGILTAAYVNFTKAIEFGMETADPYAGQAICLRDIDPVTPDSFAGVIISALKALEISPDYEMSRLRSLNWRDLRLILAQAYFSQSLYADANEQVVLLGGTAYPVAAGELPIELALEIQRLGNLYAD